MVTNGLEYRKTTSDGTTMDAMPQPAHAKPGRDRLLLAVAVIALFALYDIWGAWTEVGDKSGFAHGSGWTLTVIVEVYGACALWAWLAEAPGPRSRRFAKWSAAIVLILSFAGQASSHLTARDAIPPPVVVVFVSVLPVIVLAMIAVLVHFRIKDRADASEAARQDEKDAEIAALRADLEAEREALQPLRDALAAAQQEAGESAAKRAILERKLAAQATSRKRANSPRAKSATTRAKQASKEDVDARTKALEILEVEPGISGAELGPRVGMSKRWGQLHKPELVAMAADLEQ
jgi:hypothetical protein